MIAVALENCIVIQRNTPRTVSMYNIITFCKSSTVSNQPSTGMMYGNISRLSSFCPGSQGILAHSYLCSVQYSALHCSTVQCSTLQCTAVLCSAVHCTALQYTALQCSTLQCSTLHCRVIWWIIVECSSHGSSAVNCWNNGQFTRNRVKFSILGIPGSNEE